MVDDDSYDDVKDFDLLFEPDNAEVLTRLKDGPKTSPYLSKIFEISEEKLDEKLSHLIEKGFINKIEKDGEVYYNIVDSVEPLFSDENVTIIKVETL